MPARCARQPAGALRAATGPGVCSPPVNPYVLIRYEWFAWFASWMLAAWWRSRAQARAGIGREGASRIAIIAGALVMFASERFVRVLAWPVSVPLAWALDAVALVGFLFTWWARLTLGRLWSGNVTRKADHHIVDTGPYALVRHPIYTGLALAMIATAAMTGSFGGLLGGALVIYGFYLKARVEEQFLREGLGAEAYDAYARRVPMLVPFTRFSA